MLTSERIARLRPDQRRLLELRAGNHRAEPRPLILRRTVCAGELIPATSAQQRLWFLQQLAPNSTAYNIVNAVRLRGPLDKAALERALGLIVQRHEILRTRFVNRNGEPYQAVDSEETVSITHLDVSREAPSEQVETIKRAASVQAATAFDLEHDRLVRITLVRQDDRNHVLLIVMHHIITDAWSMNIFLAELIALYELAASGNGLSLPDLPIQYADYALWQRETLDADGTRAEIRHWLTVLQGAPDALDLPTDRARNADSGFSKGVYRFSIDPVLLAEIDEAVRILDVTRFMFLLGCFQLLISDYAREDDVVVGTTTANRDSSEIEGLIGLFANMVAIRARINRAWTIEEFMSHIRDSVLDAMGHREVPFEKIVESLNPARDLKRHPIFQVLFSVLGGAQSPESPQGIQVEPLVVEGGSARFDMALEITAAERHLIGVLEYNADIFALETIVSFVDRYHRLVRQMTGDPKLRLYNLETASLHERMLVSTWNETRGEDASMKCIHEVFEQRVALNRDTTAIRTIRREWSYGQLDAKANQLANHLLQLGAGPEMVVGICLERDVSMIAAVFAVLKAGAAYLPLDPGHPAARRGAMLGDSGTRLLITDSENSKNGWPDNIRLLVIDRDLNCVAHESVQRPASAVQPGNLAYVIFTSGSTGRPKGSMITHGNIVNFFEGMDRAIGTDPGVWLAVTSLSFDISVLELIWTLCRGFEVFLQEDFAVEPRRLSQIARLDRPLDFSLFFFSSEASDDSKQPYKLLIESAQWADQHGFKAVWTPERHFHRFGGLYPNPSVLGAALAMVTEKVQIRAGSVVLPLHSPVRVVEEWSVVDNLSQGRIGLSFASGWHADDFVLAPHRYSGRKQETVESVDTVRKLWRGETVLLANGVGEAVEVRTLPRPVQRDLPIWLTAAGSEDTFRAAGAIGANLLTHLLGQTLEELETKIAAYRAAWKSHGHSGSGVVSVMLHTFVGRDDAYVREVAKGPLRNYIRDSLDLISNLARSADDRAGGPSDADVETLISHAAERYLEEHGLFGTPERCMEIIAQLRAIGVNEVACLIDFGIDCESILQSFNYLDSLRVRAQRPGRRASCPTHLQCTPSLAKLLEANPEGRTILRDVGKLLLGGEPLPKGQLEALRALSRAEIYNMYGPTETSVWATFAPMLSPEVTVGKPLRNIQIYILDKYLQEVPLGLQGEVFIGGDAVGRGYIRNPVSTAERFVPNPFASLGRRSSLSHGRRRQIPAGWPDRAFGQAGRSDQDSWLSGRTGRDRIGLVQT